MEVVESYPFRVTRNADVHRNEETAEDLLEVIQEELRERRFATVVRLEVARGMPRWMLELLFEELELGESEVYEVEGPLALKDLMSLAGSAPLPSLRFRPWTPVTHPRFHLEPDDEADVFGAIAARRHPGPPPLRLLRHQRPAVHRDGGGRPGGARHQADPLPHLGRLAQHAGADPGGRGAQADRRHGGDQGPLRRGGQHRVGGGAGGGGGPRLLRRGGPEDPRQDRPRGAPGAGRRCAATSTSRPATTTRRRRSSTPTSACSPPTRRSPRTWPSSSTC